MENDKLIKKVDVQINSPLLYRTFGDREYMFAMSALRADSRVPMTIKDIVEKRIEAANSGNEDLIKGWLYNGFSTSDAIAYFNDEIKVVKNCDLLININSDTKIKKFSLVLTKEQYKKLPGKTFKRSELELQHLLDKKQAKEHPIWQELLGEMLEPYTNIIFHLGKKKNSIDSNMIVYTFEGDQMGIYLTTSEAFSTLWPLGIDGLNNNSDIGSAFGVGFSSPPLIGKYQNIKGDTK